ncbi:hypothetical protein FACS1894188_09240 [Clostridia bacterium]|nr:hypothetical protein FACS1894188_09240 [Clostridia bacterium]
MFRDFLEKLFEKNLYDTSKKLSPDMVNTVVCTGGGFGMVWAKDNYSQKSYLPLTT